MNSIPDGGGEDLGDWIWSLAVATRRSPQGASSETGHRGRFLLFASMVAAIEADIDTCTWER